MKPGPIPVRLMTEVLAIVTVVECALMLGLPDSTTQLAGVQGALLNVALLALLSAPPVYLRCMQATRAAASAAAVAPRPSSAGSPRRLGDPAGHRRQAIAATAAAYFLGLALTATATIWIQGRLDTEARIEFDRQVERLEREAMRRFREPINGLRGARAVYAASTHVTRADFRAYADVRSLKEFPGALGFGFIQRVPRGELAAFVADVRADDGGDFRVHTSGEAPELYVVRHIEPLASNYAAWGYDVGSDPVRLAAVRQAIDTGEPTLTQAIRLVQGVRDEPGYLLLMPIYRAGADPMTEEQRRRALVGIAYMPLVASDLLAGAAAAAGGQLDFEVFDGDGTRVEQVVYDADGHLQAAAPAAGAMIDARRYRERQFETARSLPVGGRLLTLRASTASSFSSAIDRSAAAYVALAGALLSFIGALAVWALASGRVRALGLAQRMTADLDRLAAVARHTSNGVHITDRQMRIVWINEGFTRITGYTTEEALGRTPGELLSSGQADLQALQALETAVQSGTGCRVQILNRAKDGRTYWVDTELQPLHDDSGVLTGFMEISTDVTEQRRTLDALEAAQREGQALLRTIHAHSIVSVADRTGTIIDVNDRFCTVTGYSRDELIGQNHRIVNSGWLDKEAWREIWRGLAHGEPWHGEVRNRRKDGTHYWVDAVIMPFMGRDGKPEKYVSIRSDITALKEATAQLEHERQRLDNILRGTDAGTWEYRVTTGETTVNERWATMLGYTLPEVEPVTLDSWKRRVHPDDQPVAMAALQRHLDGQTPDYVCELRMKHRLGHWVWVLTRGRVVERDGQGHPITMAGTHQDITVRKSAQEAASLMTMRLESILRGTHVGTMEWDIVTGEMSVNARWAEMLGYTLDELSPLTVQTWLALTHPVDQKEANARLVAHFKGTSANFDAEIRMRHKAGHWVWVHCRGAVCRRDDNGRALYLAGTQSNISERKRAEDELRQRNETFRVILENLPCGLSVFDADLNLVSYNVEFTQLLDLPDHLFAGPVTTFESIIRLNVERGEYGPGNAEEMVETIVDHARHPAPHHFERTRPDGLVVEVRGVPLPDGGFVTTYTNATERKLAEAALEESEHLMRLVIDYIPGRLAYFDARRRLKFANRASYAFYGGSPETSPGQRFDEFVGPVYAKSQLPYLDDVYAGQTIGYEFDREMPDGEHAYSMVHLIPDLREGQVHGFVGMATDVTPIKKAEQEVRRAEALLRGAIDAVNAAFVLYDPQDRLVFCNDKYRELYASSADLIVPGASFEEIVRTGAERGQYRDAIGRVDEWVAERMALHRSPSTFLEQHLDDGRWLRVVERRMPDGHIVGFRIDITDLKNATEAAESASRAKSQFLANMSHEIRTPMNAILGMLKLLRSTELNARQRDYTEKTERAARALLGLLNDILDFSKVEAGKLELDPRPFRLDRLMRDLSVIVSANLGAKPVEVLFRVDPAVPRALVADDLRLQQVLINLSGNAIKFTERGEVVIGVRQVAANFTDSIVEFSVRDTGIGIAPEHQARIFSGFSQAEASTTRRFGGTGLGLAISQRLVQMMGGEMTLQSAPGEGSCFSFTLPMPIAHEETVEDGPRGQVPPLRVLVVDDNPTAREVLTMMTESLGWQVEVAASGEDAVAMVQRRMSEGAPYGAAFVDWQMPGLDGWETSQRIRALCGAGAPLLMMVTAHGRSKLAERPAEDQSLLDGYLVKPVTASMLLDAVVDARSDRGEGHPSRSAAQPAGHPRLQGLRILVVEDNANNQQVAQELLEGEGAHISLAADGQQGVQAVADAQPPFDLVLMDLQMPVMDGFTATGEIRSRLGLARLPIVAMTANAMASDRDACLAAGMNAHVGKPFDLDQLVDTIVRQTGHRPVAPAPAPGTVAAGRGQPRSEVQVPAELLDDALGRGIDFAAALSRMSGRADVLLRMAGSFAQQLGGAADELAGHLARGAREDASRQMHTLKGLAATLGAVTLAKLAAEAEKALGGPATPQADATWPTRVREAALRTQANLAELLPRLREATQPTATAAPAPGGPDLAALRPLFDKLVNLLKDMDMSATDVYAELQQGFAASAPESLAAVGEAVSALDFESALAHCDALAQAWTR